MNKPLYFTIFPGRPRLLARSLALICSVLLALFAWGTFTTAQTSAYITELVGTSTQGRPITAYRFGNGPTRLGFVGGMHQGDESNSTELINRAIEYYSQHAAAIPRDLSVIFIPNANPDGYLQKTRHNSHGVDLNRNWPTRDWKADTYDAAGLVLGGGGKAPLSEPETAAMWNYIKANNLLGVIWYHARGGLVVDTAPTANGQRYASYLARLLAASTGYAYKGVWNTYDISGDASDYLNSKGIYSLTIELNDYNEIDWTQNLRGFASAISFFSTRTIPETGQNLRGPLLAYWASNGGSKVIGNPTGEQQLVSGRIWQQFENGTLTYDQSSGMVGWLAGARVPAANASVIAQAAPPLPQTVPAAGPGPSTDAKATRLRNSIDDLKGQVTTLQKDFERIASLLGQPVAAPRSPVEDIKPPASDLARAVKVVLGPNSTATVFAYERGKLVRSLAAFSGKQGYETPRGDFKIRYKHPNLQTSKWYEEDGTEYILKSFSSFTGASLGYSDDWAFHQMRIPVSGSESGRMQPGPTHGCLALTPADSTWFYTWATEGTPVTIY